MSNYVVYKSMLKVETGKKNRSVGGGNDISVILNLTKLIIAYSDIDLAIHKLASNFIL